MSEYPQHWQIDPDFDPVKHVEKFMGRDYLNVQNRLLWFIRDQRAFIASGLARMPYIVQTDLIEIDRQEKWAHFKTYVRDVLGNEATMYGSESATDFPDYAEKASTKSLGRALLLLGYGTKFAAEMDEGERVVDAPVDRQSTPATRATRNAQHAPPPATAPRPRTPPATTAASPLATQQQRATIHKLSTQTQRAEPDYMTLTTAKAGALITDLAAHAKTHGGGA